MSALRVAPCYERAERLHLVLAQPRGVPYLDAEEAFAMTPLTEAELATLPKVTDEDLTLATAMLNVEAARRERQYAALERLSVLVAHLDGFSLDARVTMLDGSEFAEAAAWLLVETTTLTNLRR